MYYGISTDIKLQWSHYREKNSVFFFCDTNTGVSGNQNTQNFPKNEHFLLPDMHTYICVSGERERERFVFRKV